MSNASATTPQPPRLPKAVPSVLLPEILGFSPQLLLDDIINSGNTAVADAVNAMEEFLQRWADQRAEKLGGHWDGTQEVEQGLIAFQTLLEYHTDVAFDFFEAWSLRNIFTFPPDLPIVVPHQAGLDLSYPPEREQELMDEIADLRRQIDNRRRLNRLYTRAVRQSNIQRRLSQARLARVAFLDNPTFDTLSAVPKQLTSLYASMTALPTLDPTAITALTQFQLTDPGKRQWETSKTGYLSWAVEQLVAKARRQDGAGGSSAVGDLVRRVEEVGTAEDLRAALVTEGKVPPVAVIVTEDDNMVIENDQPQ